MPQQSFELERVVEKIGMQLALGLEPRLHLERVDQRKIAALLGRRIQLDDFVGLGERQPEHAPNVANRLLALDRAERDYLRHAIVAVLLAHVFEHLVAPLEAKIHVDIRHRLAPRIQPSLEQQAMLDWVDLGDSQRVRNEAADHRAAARTHRNAQPARVTDKVGDDQHVAGEAHVANDGKLAIDALLVLRLVDIRAPRANFRQPRRQTLARSRFHFGVEVNPRPRLENRKMKLAEFEFEIDSPRYLDAVAQLLGVRAERTRHLVGRLDVELVGVEPPARLVGHGLAGLDAEQDLVRLGVVAMQIVAIIGRHQRQPDLLADFAQGIVVRRMKFVVLQLEIVPARKHLRVRFGGLARLVHAILPEPSRDLTRQASRQHDQSVRQLGENVLVDARLVVEAVLVRRRQQPAKISVTLAILREDYQVEVAAAVEVVAARNLRAIGALARREIHLASDDRLDADRFRLLIELDRAEHVAMVGHRDRFHPRRLGVLDQRPDFVGAVEKAVLRVDVKMDETHSGHSPCTGLAALRCAPFPLTSILLARVAAGEGCATRASESQKTTSSSRPPRASWPQPCRRLLCGRTLGGSCSSSAFRRRAFDRSAFDRFRHRGNRDFRNGRRQHGDHWIVGIENRLHLVRELHRRDVDDVVDVDFGDVDLDQVGNFQRQAFHRRRALERREDSTVGDALGLADELERNFDANRAVEIHFVQVRVQDFARHRGALHVLENHVLAVELRGARLELDDPSMRGGRNPRLQLDSIDRQRHRRRRRSVQYRGHAAAAPQRVVLTLGSGRTFLAG